MRNADHPDIFERIVSSLEGMDEQTRAMSADRDMGFVVKELSKLSNMQEPLHQLNTLQSTLAVWQQASRLAVVRRTRRARSHLARLHLVPHCTPAATQGKLRCVRQSPAP